MNEMMTPPTLTVASPTAEQMCGGSPRSSVQQDRKDLERFAKFFTLKCVQVIVQSRLGEKIKSCSKPLSTGADWFNLTIEDNAEILQETKRAISATSLPGQPPLYIEISLKTPEDTLILELWSLSFKQELQEPNIRILYTVYNRMALLLKSVISVTRVIPAYKLSRMKTSDYIMCYNIYTAEQRCNLGDLLGHEYKHVELGTVGTPFGGLVFELSYRTRLEIIVPVNNVMMIKSDHYGHIGNGAKEIQTHLGTPSSPPHRLHQQEQTKGSEKVPAEAPCDVSAKSAPLNILGAFEPNNGVQVADGDDDPSMPFSNLLKQSVKFQKLQNHHVKPERREKTEIIPEVSDIKLDSGTSDSSSSGAGDRNPTSDFIMVDLKTPFACSPAPSSGGGAAGNNSSCGTESDPIAFFNQVKEAPLNLTSLESNLPGLNVNFDVELNCFEESVGEYDDFVQKLCGENGDVEESRSSGSVSGPKFAL